VSTELNGECGSLTERAPDVRFCPCAAEVIDGKHQGECPLTAPREWFCGWCDGGVMGAPCTCPKEGS
jgi:hypothetical protein